MINDNQSIKGLFVQAVHKAGLLNTERGRLGKHVGGQPTIIEVPNEPGSVWVTRANQESIKAKVKGIIPLEEDYPVEFHYENGTPVILGKSVHPSLPVQSILTTLRVVSPPATSGSTGQPGDVAFDATHLYLCVATDTWLQFTGSTF